MLKFKKLNKRNAKRNIVKCGHVKLLTFHCASYLPEMARVTMPPCNSGVRKYY